MPEEGFIKVYRGVVIARLQSMGYIVRTDYSDNDPTVTAVGLYKQDGTSYVYTLYPEDFLRDYIVEHVVFSINNMIANS